MELRSWLERKAGLSGKRLQVAVEACETNFMETVEDLQLTAKNESEYEKIFKQGVIRVRISAALASDVDQISLESKLDTLNPRENEAANKTAPDVPKDLPEGKRSVLCSSVASIDPPHSINTKVPVLRLP